MTTNLYNEIIEWLKQLIADTKWNGHVYAVGGCCRDRLLGLEIKDLDLAIDLPMGGVKFARWLRKKRLLAEPPVLFVKFGTARLHLRRWPHEEIELVQTRREQYTKENSRCPEVVFGTIEEDCWRRDFTVNSLYYNITTDETVDITGRGIADMEAGVLRTPLDPDDTFDDDPVRILRCLRFSVRFGWTVEPSVMDALLRHVDRLTIVSRERNRSELNKMLSGPHPVQMMELLRSTGVLPYMLPLMQEIYDLTNDDGQTVWSETMNLLMRLDEIAAADTAQRLAALFAYIGKTRTRVQDKRGRVRFPCHELIGADMTRKLLKSMKFEPEVVEDTTFFILNMGATDSWGAYGESMTDKELRRLQYKCVTGERMNRLLELVDARGVPPDRLALIRKRNAMMMQDGTSMFGFRLPGGNAPVLDRNIELACEWPLRPASDFMAEPEVPPSASLSRTRRRRSYRRRHKNSQSRIAK